MMPTTRTTFTVQDAADRVGKTPGRIRQICREHAIGECIENRVRVLSQSDVDRIADIISERGKNFRKGVDTTLPQR